MSIKRALQNRGFRPRVVDEHNDFEECAGALSSVVAKIRKRKLACHANDPHIQKMVCYANDPHIQKVACCASASPGADGFDTIAFHGRQFATMLRLIASPTPRHSIQCG